MKEYDKNNLTEKLIRTISNLDTTNIAQETNKLDELERLFEEENFVPNFDFYINILQVQRVSETIKRITTKNAEFISLNRIDKITTNLVLTSLIEIYCLLNGIEIGRTEEKDVFEGSASLYISELNWKLLTREEEQELFVKISKGDMQARKTLIECNLKLVVSIAKKYTGNGVDFMDLVQEGNIGLITAVNKFDAKKGYKFSTYAYYWIKNYISNAVLSKSRNIKVPTKVSLSIKKYNEAEILLHEKLNRPPRLEEIAKEMNLPIEKVSKLCMLKADTVSLSTLIGNEGKQELSSNIPADIVPLEETIAATVTKESLKKDILYLFERSNLNEREIDVIKARYGFDGNVPKTLRQIGNSLGYTAEYIRQVEARALKKIRNSAVVDGFIDYVDYPKVAVKNLKLYRKMYAMPKDNKTNANIKSLMALKTPDLENFIRELTPKEAVIMYLKLGYVDDKYYSTREIARYLKMEISEVSGIIAEVFSVYKDRLSNTHDKDISGDGSISFPGN